jgi:hypothetical protein
MMHKFCRNENKEDNIVLFLQMNLLNSSLDFFSDLSSTDHTSTSFDTITIQSSEEETDTTATTATTATTTIADTDTTTTTTTIAENTTTAAENTTTTVDMIRCSYYNLFDRNFQHLKSGYSTIHIPEISKYIQWDRSARNPQAPTVLTDSYLNDHNISKLKVSFPNLIAWLLEPRVIHSFIYSWTLNHSHFFKEIWTHDDQLIQSLLLLQKQQQKQQEQQQQTTSMLVPMVRWIPTGGCWIQPKWLQMNLSELVEMKNQLCSFIASTKNKTNGHQFRNRARSEIQKTKWLPPVHIMGKGTSRRIEHKVDALKNYYFSIAIENSIIDTYFTEKVIDCFLTRTIPLYWGTQKISHYFDSNGILQFETIPQLIQLIRSLSKELYLSKLEAVETNFNRAKEFIIVEEWHQKKQLHPFLDLSSVAAVQHRNQNRNHRPIRRKRRGPPPQRRIQLQKQRIRIRLLRQKKRQLLLLLQQRRRRGKR